ncbi:hypothetical protein CTAM01_16047 [Colletotrichum tamarilloi]|uniref:Uncharacterized protein n=1 Tax=Colletotrichum tamarilloi TaxID=1209934 RepID=A0ABQ9QJQ0_9PEZI|nr:uncharacterized protein CTAM01_16047 [Colletotrichum tamarilloi]KAK1474018.1 hypothetical protein CTAM01_16047 [Colletotrichum tamarilloi]
MTDRSPSVSRKTLRHQFLRLWSVEGNLLATADGSSRTAYRTAVKLYNDEPTDDSVSIGEGIEQEPVQVPGFPDQTPHSHGSASTFQLGDDSSTELFITFRNFFMRSYNSSCGAFLDLTNPVTVGEKPTSLQLRSIVRLQAVTHMQSDSQEMKHRENHMENVIPYWTLQTKADGESQRLADALILWGQDSQWDISGVADDRSLMYISGNTKTFLPLLKLLTHDYSA